MVKEAGSYMDIFVETFDSRLDVLHGHQHVLHHMVLLIQAADRLSLGQFQQRDLGRHHPAKHIPEQWIIPKWYDVLKTGMRESETVCCQ